MPNWKKVVVSGSDAILNSLYVTGPITGSDIKIDDWGSVSASLASIEAGAISQTLQDVTDNGSTTTNNINVAGITASSLIYPSTDGLVNQGIITDGAGNLTFGNPQSDNTVITIKNVSGGSIAKGTPLYITASGASGNLIGVVPADAGNPAVMPAGVIAGEALPNNGDEGIGLINGFINGVDTSAFSAGDEVFVAVGGGYTNVAPTGSALVQKLGNVEKVDGSNGSGVIVGPGTARSIPNINPGYTWVGNSDWVATPISTSSLLVTSASFSDTSISASHALASDTSISASHALASDTSISASYADSAVTASYVATASYTPTFQQVTDSGATTTNGIEVGSLNSTGLITGSDVSIDDWGSISASLAAIESTGSSQNLQQVTDNGNTTTNALNVTRTGATDAVSTFKNINGSSQLQIISSGSSGTLPGVASIRFESYADPSQTKFASLIYDGKVNKDFLYLINAGGANVGISGSNVDSRLVVGGASGSLYIGLDNTDPVITRDGSADALFFGTASYANVSATASFLPSDTNLNITSITASTANFQSASIGYLTTITGSATIVGDAFIILNTADAQRYAGIIVEDSGSAPTNYTASYFYDSQTNDWNYEYTTPGGTDFGVALFGPEYSTKGSPTYLTDNKIPKATDNHHLIDSNISDNGSIVSISTPLDITGSITGSDVKIDDWGSISASLASIEATVPTLQQVTDEGNTTTNNIIVSGSIIKYGTGARNRLDVGASYTTHSGSLYIYHPTLFSNTGLKAVSLEGGQLDFRSYQGVFGTASAHQIGLDTVTSTILKFKTGPTAGSTAMTIDGTGHVVIGADSTASLATDSLTIVGGDLNLSYNDIRQVGSGSFSYVSSSDAYIDDWGSISSSLASINLQQITDNGSVTTNAITVNGSTIGGDIIATNLSASNNLYIEGSTVSTQRVLVVDNDSYTFFSPDLNDDYHGGVIEYTLFTSGKTNLRTGTIMWVANSSEVSHTETTTAGIGDTSAAVISSSISGTSVLFTLTNDTGAGVYISWHTRLNAFPGV